MLYPGRAAAPSIIGWGQADQGRRTPLSGMVCTGLSAPGRVNACRLPLKIIFGGRIAQVLNYLIRVKEK